MKGVRLGVAGHNLFDLAFAHLLGAERGVSENLDFEMLQGMAAEQQGPISDDVGQLLLYVPAVRPEEFDVAISYLVRRLEENASSENFMSGIFELEPGNEIFVREENRFRSSVDTLEETIEEHGETPPGPNHTQNRGAEEVAQPTDYTDAELPAFANEPDTDPTLAANQQWGSGGDRPRHTGLADSAGAAGADQLRCCGAADRDRPQRRGGMGGPACR